MKVLVIGSGAREHALCRSLSLDPDVTALYCAPGNAGIAEVAELHPVDALDGAAVARLATGLGADLVVVGPEAPLVAGVADAVRVAGIDCFGPSAEAARLEGSKAFAKDVMAGAGVPTARSYVCTTAAEIDTALDAFGAPYVVKDDGLAAGKGVVVTEDVDEAREHALNCVSAGGGRVVVEEFLDGPEVSLFAVTDGRTVVPLQPAQDFKRALDGDQGPNTGGMGAYSPLPWADPKLVDEVLETVLQPTVDELRRRGTPSPGCSTRGSRSPRAVSASSSSTPASATPRPRWSWPACGPRSPGCCAPPPTAPSPRSRRCAGARRPRSPWSSPRTTTRVRRAPATRSRGWPRSRNWTLRRRTSCTPVRARTATPSSARAAGSSR